MLLMHGTWDNLYQPLRTPSIALSIFNVKMCLFVSVPIPKKPRQAGREDSSIHTTLSPPSPAQATKKAQHTEIFKTVR